MAGLINKMKVLLLGMRVVSQRTREESAVPYLRGGSVKYYGLIIVDKPPIFRDCRVVSKMSFHFDRKGIFNHQKGVGKLGQDINTLLVIWIDAALAIYNGKYRPKKGSAHLPYDIWVAARLGHLKFDGEASTSDIMHFNEVLTRRPEVKSKYLRGVKNG